MPSIGLCGSCDYVKIKIPYQIEGTALRIFNRPRAAIYIHGTCVWCGELGSLARFQVGECADVMIDLGCGAEKTTGLVCPGFTYRLEYLGTGSHLLARYALVKF